jgi:hypothetical protein
VPLLHWGAHKIDALSTDLARMLENAPSIAAPAAAQDKAPHLTVPIARNLMLGIGPYGRAVFGTIFLAPL